MGKVQCQGAIPGFQQVQHLESILDPILFFIYANENNPRSKVGKSLKYSDNTILYFNYNQISKQISKLNPRNSIISEFSLE